MGLIERLRSNRPIPTLPHEAADALERLKGYAVHDAGCSGYRDDGESCSCGLSALLREIDGE